MSLVRRRLVVLVALFCLELLALAVAYQFFVSFECRATDAEGACRLLRSLVARALTVLAAMVLLASARPQAFARLAARLDRNPDGAPWRALHAAGVALLAAPLLLAGRDSQALFSLALAPWLIGAVAASVGALFWLAPPREWLAWLREERFVPLVMAVAAVLIPDLAGLARPIWWDWPALADVTFGAVRGGLELLGGEPVSDLQSFVLGMDGFHVRVAEQCAGIEGLALVAGFTVLYAVIFRRETRFPHFWLVVLPVGLLLSWALNVFRIGALVWIGARVSPELAVNGFHSYAGWMFFTLLALGLLCTAQAVPWLRAGPRTPAPPIRDDWAAACILPFVAFMVASAVSPALSTHPDLAYPLKALALGIALALFHRAYRRLQWTPDPVALSAGAIVGVAWVAFQPPAGGDAALVTALAGLGTAAFVAWVVVRVVGTVLLVPLAEELFFRGYVLTRLDRGGTGARVLAIAVSTALFAALHGRWLAAALAGLIFALVMLRRGRLADAVVAHVAANLAVAIWALTRNDWGAI